MRRFILPALALAATGLAALPVGRLRAEVVTLGTAGAWRALGGTADNGRALCGIAETGSDGRAFMMRYVAGAPAFDLLLTKPRWAIPRGTRVAVAVTFDQLAPWTGVANGEGTTMTLSVPQDRLRPFLVQFVAANRVYLRFTEGGEAPWQGSLAGSRAIVTRLADCIRALPGRGQVRQEEDTSQPSGAPRDGGKPGIDHGFAEPRPAVPPRSSAGGGIKD